MAVVGDTINIVKHLKSGDPAPEINASKYTLFAYRFCPFCDRVRLTLNHHKIEHDLVLIALADKPDWFKQMSPSGKVPMLLNEGAKLIESDLIMRFVDELRGTDAQLLGVCGMDKFNEALALTSKYYKPAHTILFKESYNSEDETTFRNTCGELDKQIKGKYFAGDQLSLADFALFPVLDRLEVIMNQLTKHTAPDHLTEWTATEAQACDWPVLASYIVRMRQLPDVATFRQTTRIQALFAESMRRGAPNPDIV